MVTRGRGRSISRAARYTAYCAKSWRDVRVAGEAINLGGVDRIRCTAKDSSSTVGDMPEEPGEYSTYIY